MEISIGSSQGTFNRQDYRIDLDGRTFLTGQSGTGKSTLMRGGFIQVMQSGEACGFTDFHGDTAEDLLRYIPRNRMRDVLYIDPFSDYPVSLNFFRYTTELEKEMKIQSFISTLKSIHRLAWGDETERIITGALDAVTEFFKQPNPLAITLFISRAAFRKRILKACKNPMLADFEEQYEDKLRPSEQMAKFSPPLNKTDDFVRPILSVMLGQERTIDFDALLKRKPIIICNLNKGKLGEVASLIGCLISNEIWHAILRRNPNNMNPAFYWFMDEAQNALHGIDVESLLSESRKYKLFPFFGTQYLSKIPNMEAAFGNYSTWLTYRLGGTDAIRLAEEWHDDQVAREIVNLPSYHFIGRRLLNGTPDLSYMVTARKKVKKLGNEPPRGAVIAESSRRWGIPRDEAAQKVREFLAS